MKVVTANEVSLFEERLARTLQTLPADAVVVEVGFDTTALPSGAIQFSALVHLQTTETWG
ncbi:MAG: hypothetical protein U5J97_09205 [Trueperaceae bacterium]|nr:hypothetical protein [Trueperaceae bacterium]